MQGPGITIDCHPRGLATIRADRPVHAARLFEGKSPETVTEMIPLVFAVCSVAQGVAASHALGEASGRQRGRQAAAAQGALVRLEIAREHLWRALIDWPRFANVEVPADALASMQALLPAARSALFEGSPFAISPAVSIDRDALDRVLADFDDLLQNHVLGVAAEAWLELATLDDLARFSASSSAVVPALVAEIENRGWSSSCSADPRFLPRLAFDDIEAELTAATADRFIEAPELDGTARETTPLSRQSRSPLVEAVVAGHGAGMLARTVAAVNELAATSTDIVALLEGSLAPGIEAAAPGPDTGIAQVEAARGRLLHRAVVRDGRVVNYRIVAPTEWNFHPGGVVSRALATLPWSDRRSAHDQADLFVTLMDPCVAYSLEVH